MKSKTKWRCLMRGHRKEWEGGFFGPTWTCLNCGKTGDLESHSRMSGSEWLAILIPTILIVVGVLYLARDYL